MNTVWLYAAMFLSALFALAAVLGVYFARTESRGGPPVEPDTLLEAVDEAAVVLDTDDTVVMANVTFRSLFDADPTGRRLADVLADQPDVLAAATSETDETLSLGIDGERRHLEVHTHPLGEGISEDRRRLVLVRDVTGRESRERALEQHNKRLEEVASVISHDLRNPLDVAIGRTNAAGDIASDPEVETHLTVARDAHDRMRHIIGDVLTLAREDSSVRAVSDVPLEQVADDAWRHVDTGAASLAVDTDAAVRADREGLVRILENLFRNAVEHGTSGEQGPTDTGNGTTPDRDRLTVRVDSHDDGFYVADDGVGVPADQHEVVFEAGRTGESGGTGLGLAIVDRVAGAHDWQVRLVEAADGGARVEFSGVEITTDDTVEPNRP